MDYAIQERITGGKDKTHQTMSPGGGLAPKYRGRYGDADGGNIVVTQGSAISALLFIIYLDDMVEDLAALNRRTKLPIGIIQDYKIGHVGRTGNYYWGSKKEEAPIRGNPGNSHNQKCRRKYADGRRAQDGSSREKETQTTKRSLPKKTKGGTGWVTAKWGNKHGKRGNRHGTTA